MPAKQSLIARSSKQLSKKASTAPKATPSWLLAMYKQHREARDRWTEPGTPFPVGQKKVFLPDFTVTLQYNPTIPPTHAQFQVPLSFNKLDLRDYLWHAYAVRTHAIRSWVSQQPIRFVERGSWRDIPGKKVAYRPKALKRMIVKLDRPFVWPEAEKEASAAVNGKFDSKIYEKMKKDGEERLKKRQRGRQVEVEDERVRKARALMRYRNELLEGKVMWKSGEKVGGDSDGLGSGEAKASGEEAAAGEGKGKGKGSDDFTKHEKKVLERARRMKEAGIEAFAITTNAERRRRRANTA